MSKNRRGKGKGEIVFGFVLLFFGALLLLDNVDIIDAGSVWQYWPFLIVAFGINKIMNSNSRKETGSGAWLIFLGLWLYVSFMHAFGLGFRDTWPMLIIAWGVSEIWKALAKNSHMTIAKENGHATE